MKVKKELLVGLLVGAGLYNTQNAQLFVQTIKSDAIDGIIKVLSSDQAKPAIRVAAATGPNLQSEDKTHKKV